MIGLALPRSSRTLRNVNRPESAGRRLPRFRRPMVSGTMTEPLSSCVAVGFEVVQDEDRLHDRGHSPWAAAQLARIFQVLRVSIARSPRARIFAWARLMAFCDRIGQSADPVHGGGQVIGGRREQGYRFLHVPPRGAHADGEPGGRPDVGITVAKVSQGEQCLPPRLEAPPPGSALVAVAADSVGQVGPRRDQRRALGSWRG